MKPHSKSIFTLAAFLLVAAMAAAPSSQSAQAAGTWYVATTGSDGNDCLTPSTPCGTINGAMGKAASGDTIKVVVGTYSSNSGESNIVIDKDLKLSGGWDSAFASQNNYSTVEGGRRGVKINPGQKATIERFIFQDGRLDAPGVGVYNDIGVLELKDSTVRNNMVMNGSYNHGSGIYNSGIMTITNSIVIGNSGDEGIFTTSYFNKGNLSIIGSTINNNVDGGIANNFAIVTITNTVISGNGGGGITSMGESPRAVLQIYGSAIVDNFAAYAGGGISAGGILTITNSTIARNSAPRGGGIYAATANLSNITIAGNSATDIGGGVLGNFVLRNTIIASNRGPATSPDCSGTLVSQGFNLIEDTTGCSITGDLTGNIFGADPLFFPLLGSPGFHAVQPNSPIIDAGNPVGCTDSIGNPLITDQRGASRPLDGDGNGSAICDIGAYEFDPTNPIAVTQVFLPLTTNDYCPDFFDDFSNPYSGWPVGEDEYVRVEYLGGEYRILSKNGDYIYLFRAPACPRQNYTVEMDARWVGATGDSYGLLFGITSGFSQYYLFDMNTDYQMFRLYRRGPSGFTQIAPVTYSPAIRSGASSNHLKVTRNGSQITLAVNGTTLGTWYDGVITGQTYVGLMSNPYIDVPVSDARFDNFLVTTLQATGAGVTVTEQTSVTAQGNGPATSTLYTALPPELEWRLPEKGIPQEHK